MEAVSYCRERHGGQLLSVTSGHLQRRAARESRAATTPYVWLGLRYSCNFHFWFWVSTAAAHHDDDDGCCHYENWAPGHGPDTQQRRCQHQVKPSGAIQATGGQQWVGRDETE